MTSKTFIKGDTKKELFNLNNEINSFIHLMEASIKSNNINLVLDIDKKIDINGNKSELTQCLINIFNNAKDVLEQLNQEERFIFISSIKNKNNIIITIKDNGGGIPENIIRKIFEPYFTTKHKSQGTGLGLHMTYNLIVDGMKGMIVAKNTTYIYNKIQYTGAEFKITLPI